MKKEKIYIFDLDHTIFNAKDFKEDLRKVLGFEKAPDLSEKIWQVFKENPEKIEGVLKNGLEKYLFGNIVEKIKNINQETVLLTWGDFDFQKMKIKSLGLEEVFDRVFLTEEKKVYFLESFIQQNKDKEIYFFNDNYNKRFNENEMISEKIPEIKIFEVDNYEGDKKSILNILANTI